MSEAQKFLRFVIPGLLFFVVYLILMLVVLPSWTLEIAQRYSQDFSFLFSGIFVSAGLGYFFHTVHHALDWGWLNRFTPLNHVGNILAHQDLFDLQEGFDDIDRRAALHITLFNWYTRLGEGMHLEADKKVMKLQDTAHATGAAWIASLFALTTAIVTLFFIGQISWHCWDITRYCIMLVIGIILACLFRNTYQRVGGIVRRLIDEMIVHVIREERERRLNR